MLRGKLKIREGVIHAFREHIIDQTDSIVVKLNCSS